VSEIAALKRLRHPKSTATAKAKAKLLNSRLFIQSGNGLALLFLVFAFGWRRASQPCDSRSPPETGFSR
jgi:hypothetical protein